MDYAEAPEVRHNGNPQEIFGGSFCILNNNFLMALNHLASDRERRVLLCLCQQAEGFRMVGGVASGRAGLSRANYYTTIRALIHKGWIYSEKHKTIGINYARIEADWDRYIQTHREEYLLPYDV